MRFVSAMRLARRKRPVELVEAMAEVRAATPGVDARLEILGEGPDRAKLERRVADLGARRWVSLPGRVPRESLPARYAGADVYVSPTVLESFGIAALEARTAGLPVVSRLGSGVAEFVTDGVNGLLADTDGELAEQMARLTRDEPLRRKMTEHNLATAPAQDWSAVVQTAESEYARAIAAGQAAVSAPQLWVRGVDATETKWCGEPSRTAPAPSRFSGAEGFASLGARTVVGRATPTCSCWRCRSPGRRHTGTQGPAGSRRGSRRALGRTASTPSASSRVRAVPE